MQFSNEEEKKMDNAREQICEWIMSQVVPKLKEGDKIFVDFGEICHGACNYGNTTSEYHLRIYSEKITFYSNDSNAKGSNSHIAWGVRFGGAKDNLERPIEYNGLLGLLENWSYVKSEILKQVDKYSEKRNLIENFIV